MARPPHRWRYQPGCAEAMCVGERVEQAGVAVAGAAGVLALMQLSVATPGVDSWQCE